MKSHFRYVYTCRAKFVDLEEACSVYYAAKKYLITDLADICKAYITQEMNAGSAATVYDLAQTFQDEELFEACLKVCGNIHYLLSLKVPT